jgi:hypothetical protein
MQYFQANPSLVQNIYYYKHDAARHLNYVHGMFCLVSGRNAQEVDLRKRTPIPVLKTISAQKIRCSCQFGQLMFVAGEEQTIQMFNITDKVFQVQTQSFVFSLLAL